MQFGAARDILHRRAKLTLLSCPEPDMKSDPARRSNDPVIKDKLRTLLNIRVKREACSVGAKPRMGSKITLGGMRMYITSTPPDELWYFFSLQGWREINHPRDRRKYVDLPRASFDLLARCTSSERELRYRQLVAAATRSRAAAASGSPAPGSSTAAPRAAAR